MIMANTAGLTTMMNTPTAMVLTSGKTGTLNTMAGWTITAMVGTMITVNTVGMTTMMSIPTATVEKTGKNGTLTTITCTWITSATMTTTGMSTIATMTTVTGKTMTGTTTTTMTDGMEQSRIASPSSPLPLLHMPPCEIVMIVIKSREI